MKIDAVNFGSYANASQQIQNLKAEETNSSLDEYDETRIANKPVDEQKVSNPIEQKQGTVEDLINLQQSTEKMARSYGYANVAEAVEATSSATTGGESASVSNVSSVSGASTSNVNA